MGGFLNAVTTTRMYVHLLQIEIGIIQKTSHGWLEKLLFVVSAFFRVTEKMISKQVSLFV